MVGAVDIESPAMPALELMLLLAIETALPNFGTAGEFADETGLEASLSATKLPMVEVQNRPTSRPTSAGLPTVTDELVEFFAFLVVPSTATDSALASEAPSRAE